MWAEWVSSGHLDWDAQRLFIKKHKTRLTSEKETTVDTGESSPRGPTQEPERLEITKEQTAASVCCVDSGGDSSEDGVPSKASTGSEGG